MNTKDLLRLLTLAALWGGSFIFMRVVAPVLGPLITADLRVLIAGIVLVGYFRLIGFDPEWRRFWRHYLVIGVVNSALPFCLYAYAAQYLPASYSVILNSSAPLFGAIFGALWLGEKVTTQKGIGLLLGASGVCLIARVKPAQGGANFAFAVVACLLAAACYGLAGIYIKKFASQVKPMAIAGASQLLAGLVLIPFAPLAPASGPTSLFIVLNVLGLAIFCSAIAYLLYYRLIAEVGPTKALTVTFLMPLFGMLWGSLLLGETVTLAMIAGCLLVLLGTVLVLQLIQKA
jgi:drug/metabolite transporter (DMT)-like permease